VPDALSGDYQGGLTTLRQQVVAWLEAFADLSEERQQLQALGKSARSAVERLRKLWLAEVCSVPYYPAFGSCSEAAAPTMTDFRKGESHSCSDDCALAPMRRRMSSAEPILFDAGESARG
jgi:hypothetical protein